MDLSAIMESLRDKTVDERAAVIAHSEPSPLRTAQVCSTYKNSAKVVVFHLQTKSHEIIKTAYTSWLNDKFLFTF